MAASMLGAFEMTLPSGIMNRLAMVGGAGYRGAFLLGLVCALIATPCTGPILTGILAYIALRFQFSFAVGAVVATLHDLLVTVAFLTFFGYDMTLNIIAGLLTITGYSVNDTIVVFDRVRENMRSMRRDNLKNIVNVAVNQTLARTVITAGTTLLSVIALYLFGGEVLEGFAFTMLVGIVSGTYSTVFIAAAIAIILSGKQAQGRTQAARKAS